MYFRSKHLYIHEELFEKQTICQAKSKKIIFILNKNGSNFLMEFVPKMGLTDPLRLKN